MTSQCFCKSIMSAVEVTILLNVIKTSTVIIVCRLLEASLVPFPDYHDDISGSENEAAEEYSDATEVERHVVVPEYISEQPCKGYANDKITQFEIVIVLHYFTELDF